MSKYIAYKGKLYTVEWYFNQAGKSKAREYYDKLPEDRKRKAINIFRLMTEYGQVMDDTKFRYEGDGIYAFKPQPDRFLCFFFKDKKIVITNAFVKKAQKMPSQEKDRALRAYHDYQMRAKTGDYYDQE